MSALALRRGLAYPLTRGQARRFLPVEPESSFLQRVVEYARLQRFQLIYHTHNSQHSAAGFPDLVLVRPEDGRVVFIECKADDAPKRLPLAQEAWKDGLERCPGVDYFCWRARDWPEVQRVLRWRTK